MEQNLERTIHVHTAGTGVGKSPGTPTDPHHCYHSKAWQGLPSPHALKHASFEHELSQWRTWLLRCTKLCFMDLPITFARRSFNKHNIRCLCRSKQNLKHLEIMERANTGGRTWNNGGGHGVSCSSWHGEYENNKNMKLLFRS